MWWEDSYERGEGTEVLRKSPHRSERGNRVGGATRSRRALGQPRREPSANGESPDSDPREAARRASIRARRSAVRVSHQSSGGDGEGRGRDAAGRRRAAPRLLAEPAPGRLLRERPHPGRPERPRRRRRLPRRARRGGALRELRRRRAILSALHASPGRIAARALRAAGADRRRRNGRGLAGEGHPPRPQRRRQDPPRRLRRGRGAPPALRARGQGDLLAQPPPHLHALRRRARGRRALPGDGAARGRGPRRSPAEGPAAARPGREARGAGRRGPLRRAQAGHRPPRPQARQRRAHEDRGEAPRLRPRPHRRGARRPSRARPRCRPR